MSARGAVSQEVLPVRVGSGRECLPQPMTRGQVERWGKANMPKDLKAAGFQVDVFRSDPEINGGDFFRVSFGKHC